jgi:hypothetical protein
MTALTFDTLAYAKRLKEAGFTEPQAEGQAAALADALKGSAVELATQADLREMELRMDARFTSLHRDIEAMKADLLKWVIGLFIAQVWLFAALVKLLH